MFGIGGWEFVLIVILALLLFGPDKLPQFARTVGRFLREFKRYQDLMEATIRAEMFNADPSLRKDAFEAAKEARQRTGAGGGFTSATQPAEGEPEEPAAASEGAPATEEPAGQTGEGETPDEGETRDKTTDTDEGEGEQGKA